MGRNRFIASGVKRFDLTDGDWVEIKELLNTGETKAVESAGEDKPVIVRDPDGRDKVMERIDWKRYSIERMFVYLTDWSFKDANGKPVKITLESLAALEPESFSEIEAHIIAHILATAAAKKAAREAREKESSSLPSTNGKSTDKLDSEATSMQ